MRRYILLMVILSVSIFTHAQQTLLLESELTVPVRVDESTQVIFTLDEQQFISLEANSQTDAVDPVIWIVDASQAVRAYNDDFQGTSSARIENLLLMAGTYTLYVDSFNGLSEGEVTLSLHTASPNDIRIREEDDMTLIEGRLLEDAVYRYTMIVTDDSPVTITARDTSGTLDPYIVVYDDNDIILAENDDHQSLDLTLNTFDARLSDFDLTDLDLITIEIRDFLGRAGQFQLIIE